MLVVASANGKVGIQAAMEVLRAGGSALDAVEAGVRVVESNPEDHTVGLGGLPNLLGEVELDASIMDGATLAAGAVGALQGVEHPISVARRVMEELPHVLLVGAGAARFAAEMGFERRDLLTEEARRAWEERLRQAGGDQSLQRYTAAMRRWAKLAADPERPNETVNFIARDGRGNLAVGVSTSGWAWKYPGRLGDSPVIGAGNYADNRYGAGACTGRGEMAIRAATARSIVLYLKQGMSLEDACREAYRDLADLVDPYAGPFSLIAVDRAGRHLGVSNRPGATYVAMTAEMDEPVEAPRLVMNV
ncbi:MAG: N(4)-(beta-N-acetylglucosaminyl)-L-asparaginase [Chloroflexi bacterium]|nr:N(4)-(beta-N-acetylglucosaminyl)-L-asparaginase [Chloroflexota bacterium]